MPLPSQDSAGSALDFIVEHLQWPLDSAQRFAGLLTEMEPGSQNTEPQEYGRNLIGIYTYIHRNIHTCLGSCIPVIILLLYC